MNIFSLFSKSLQVARKVDSAANGVERADTEALIGELCNTEKTQPAESDTSASNGVLKETLPYPM